MANSMMLLGSGTEVVAVVVVPEPRMVNDSEGIPTVFSEAKDGPEFSSQ